MQVIDNNYLKGVNFRKNTERTGDLKSNFDKILSIVLADQLYAAGNLQFYPNKPNMPDTHIMILALLQEALSVDSEHWFWSKLKADYNLDFPNLPHLTCYNRRCKRLAGWIERLARLWRQALRPDEDTFIVDSIPNPVAHIARAYSTMVCRKQFHTAPDKGYSAASGPHFIGYRLHVVLTLDGGRHSMEPSKASVHDSQYQTKIKHSGLQDCLLLADKGYLSAQGQLELFAGNGIDLHIDAAKPTGYHSWPKTFKTVRRRIETTFSQLSDQMPGKRNYAKSFIGLRARLITKVTAVTLLQYLNEQNDRPINHIEHASAA